MHDESLHLQPVLPTGRTTVPPSAGLGTGTTKRLRECHIHHQTCNHKTLAPRVSNKCVHKSLRLIQRFEVQESKAGFASVTISNQSNIPGKEAANGVMDLIQCARATHDAKYDRKAKTDEERKKKKERKETSKVNPSDQKLCA